MHNEFIPAPYAKEKKNKLLKCSIYGAFPSLYCIYRLIDVLWFYV